MATFDVEFDVICTKCGRALGASAEQHRNSNTVRVEPCTSCLEDAKNEGYADGLKEAETDGE